MQELDACLCGEAETRCDDRCVDTRTDTGHCGGCGSPVAPPRICRDGAPACPTIGDAYCPQSDVCADLYTSTSHCGACDDPTGSARVCREGVPVCRWDGYTYCPEIEQCKKLTEDRDHCGTCGNDLPGDQVCDNGVPKCSYDYDLMCDGSCIYPNANQCGSCERVCPAVAGAQRKGCTRGGHCTYLVTSQSRQRCEWICSGYELGCITAELVRWTGQHWRDKGCDYDPPHYNGGYFESIDCICEEN